MLNVRSFIQTAIDAIRRATERAAVEPVGRWAYPEVELTCRSCGFKQTWQTQTLIDARGDDYDLRHHLELRRRACGKSNCTAEIVGMEVDRFYR